MEALLDIYDRTFFGQYGRGNAAYASACARIAAELARRFTPVSAVDWGCGAGLYVGALCRAGIDAVGVDGVLVDADLRDPDAPIVVGDLRSIDAVEGVPSSFDLSLCVDVLEHIDEQDSERALLHIVRGARLVILSCAPPFQGGHHHVNEQPRGYWIRRMAALGWAYQRRETGSMESGFIAQREKLPFTWMYHNLTIYRPAARP